MATPGRLTAFIETGRVTLSAVEFLVLDEADRMLEMGFLPQVRRIIEDSDMTQRESRQTLMFSATFPRPIQALARDFLRSDYINLTVGELGSACLNITQEVIHTTTRDKRDALEQVLSREGRKKFLIFVQRKVEVIHLDNYLFAKGFPCTTIHGDLTQEKRERSMDLFRCGKTPILIATDLASRGLDIPRLDHVILFDMPRCIEDYVHRFDGTCK